MPRASAAVTLAGAMIAAAAAIGGCGGPRDGSGAGPAGALSEEPCTGIPVTEARCLRLTVYENQASRRGRTIPLRIVVLPATETDRARRESDAIVYLAGGPGQAATELIGDSSLRRRRPAVAPGHRLRGSAGHRRFERAPLSVLRSTRSAADLLRRVSPDRQGARVPVEARADVRPGAVHDERVGRGPRGDQGRARVSAADARRRLLRDTSGDGVRPALRAARARRHPREPRDARQSCARTLRGVGAARARRLARRVSGGFGVCARVPADPRRGEARIRPRPSGAGDDDGPAPVHRRIGPRPGQK